MEDDDHLLRYDEEEERPSLKRAECGICKEMEILIPVVLPVSHDHYEKTLCRHVFCAECLKSWIQAKISENMRVFRCPQDGCDARMFGDDIERIDPSSIPEYTKIMAQDHKERLKTLEDTEPELFKLLQKGSLKTCPDCGILLVRSVGCSRMQCTCGAQFCYTCLQHECDCNLEFQREEFADEEGGDGAAAVAAAVVGAAAGVHHYRHFERQLTQIDRILLAIERQRREEAEAEARKPRKAKDSTKKAASFLRAAEENREDLPLSQILALAANRL